MMRRLGRYDLIAELGRGGMADVYLARLTAAGGFAKHVAVKRILPGLAHDASFVEMFLREGRIAATLSHPNLCSVHELGDDGDELYLVMEYLDGVSWAALADALPRDAWGLRVAAGALIQACDGLHHAHTMRDVDGAPAAIVHRDVSPQNLFVTIDGVCKVLDFGISVAASDPRRTRTGVAKGKPPYMAPEQIRGERSDARADVWAVGVVLWEALAGRTLFAHATDFLTYRAIHEAPIPRLAGANTPYLTAIDDVVSSALEHDRAKRCGSARELADTLGAAAAPVGGPMSRGELADAVRRLCADALAARRATVRLALGADATLVDPATRNLVRAATTAPRVRDESFAVLAPVPRKRWTAIRAIGAGVAGASAVAIAVVATSRSDAGESETVPAAIVEPGVQKPAVRELAVQDPVVQDPDVRASPGRPPAVRGAVVRAPATRTPAVRASASTASKPRAADKATSSRDKPPDLPGTLTIDADGFASIYIDGQLRGDTPLRLTVPAGVHTIRGVRNGTSTTRTVSIATGASVATKLAW
jgi:hypothetical protein